MSALQKSGSSSSVLRRSGLLTPLGCVSVAALGLVLALVLPAPGWVTVLWPSVWCLLGLVLAFRRESRQIDEIFESELGTVARPPGRTGDPEDGGRPGPAGR